MPRDISGRCIAHTNELASDLCSTCGDEFCAGCLVGTTSSKRSLCVGCALAAAGVRSTAKKRVRPIGGRELRKRREASLRSRQEAVDRAAQIDRAPWQLVNAALASSARTDPELARRALLEPVVPAHSALDPDLTAAAFATRDRESAQYPPIDTTVITRRPLEPTRPLEHSTTDRQPLPNGPRSAHQPPPNGPRSAHQPLPNGPRSANQPLPNAPRSGRPPLPTAPETARQPSSPGHGVAPPAPVGHRPPSRSLANVWSSHSTETIAAVATPAAKVAPAPPWRRRARPDEAPKPSAPAAVDITDQSVTHQFATPSPTGSPWATPPAAQPSDSDSYRPSAWAGFTPDQDVAHGPAEVRPMRAPRFTGTGSPADISGRELAGAAARPSLRHDADEWGDPFADR